MKTTIKKKTSIRLTKNQIELIKKIAKKYSLPPNSFVKETRECYQYRCYIQAASNNILTPSQRKQRIIIAKDFSVSLKNTLDESYLGNLIIHFLNKNIRKTTLKSPLFSQAIKEKLQHLKNFFIFNKIQNKIGSGYFSQLQKNVTGLLDAINNLTPQVRDEINKEILPYTYKSKKFTKCLEDDLDSFTNSCNKNIKPVRQGRPFDIILTNVLLRIMDYFEMKTKSKIKISSTGSKMLSYKGRFCFFIKEYLPILNIILKEEISEKKLLSSVYSLHKKRKKTS
jgi:hypothetical protein